MSAVTKDPVSAAALRLFRWEMAEARSEDDAAYRLRLAERELDHDFDPAASLSIDAALLAFEAAERELLQ
jgi:hypothetical protein